MKRRNVEKIFVKADIEVKTQFDKKPKRGNVMVAMSTSIAPFLNDYISGKRDPIFF